MSASNVSNFVATDELNVVKEETLIPSTLTSPNEPVEVCEPDIFPLAVTCVADTCSMYPNLQFLLELPISYVAICVWY